MYTTCMTGSEIDPDDEVYTYPEFTFPIGCQKCGNQFSYKATDYNKEGALKNAQVVIGMGALRSPSCNSKDIKISDIKK